MTPGECREEEATVYLGRRLSQERMWGWTLAFGRAVGRAAGKRVGCETSGQKLLGFTQVPEMFGLVKVVS